MMEPNEIATALASACGGEVIHNDARVELDDETAQNWVVQTGTIEFVVHSNGDVEMNADGLIDPREAMGIARLVGVMNGHDPQLDTHPLIKNEGMNVWDVAVHTVMDYFTGHDLQEAADPPPRQVKPEPPLGGQL